METQKSDSLILTCTNLTKNFGPKIALDNLNFSIDFANLGLLGPNGSGKTTLIKLIMGLIKPTSGDISLSIPISDIRVIPENPYLPQNMTIDTWITTLEKIFGKIERKFDPQSIFGLDGSWVIKELSAGQYRKAALLAIFFGKPKLLILDEPTNFLDIVSRERVLKLLKEHLEFTGAKLIITSHRVEEIRLLARKVIILKEGSILTKLNLGRDKAESIAIQVDDPVKFTRLLSNLKIKYSIDEDILGQYIRIKASSSLWVAIDEFINEIGGTVNQIRTVDKLEHTIEELIK
ncbi:MAG: ATP-binding cassette domain-containing protein [Candidatus Kariarchaeaceae archaeon]|jgi:ABC-2 type transport system ATP-binding protein